jgi:hypothetical protein
MAIEKKTHGFGSDLAKAAKFVRADIAADKIAKALGYDDCGCSGRAAALDNPDLLVNKIFYKNQEDDEINEEQNG